jgi:hypothetical protein
VIDPASKFLVLIDEAHNLPLFFHCCDMKDSYQSHCWRLMILPKKHTPSDQQRNTHRYDNNNTSPMKKYDDSTLDDATGAVAEIDRPTLLYLRTTQETRDTTQTGAGCLIHNSLS